MNYPFVIFALPRSRTAWTAAWLSYQGLRVGHDLAVTADSCQGFLDSLWPLAGTVETGAEIGHKLLRAAMREAKFVTIRRPVVDVEASFARLGITDARSELERRAAMLDEIEAAGAYRVEHASLSDARACADLWEYIYGAPFDFPHWRACDARNIQVDLAARLALIAERAEQIEALKRETASAAGPFLRVWWEPFASAWPEAERLAAEHSVEVNAGERFGHPFRPDAVAMEAMERAGLFRVMTARINGRLAGYLTWTLSADIESDGVTLADQGAWFVAADAPGGLGVRMLNKSIETFRRAGIHSVQLHHQVHGRGARLGTLFRRMGAIEHQHRYTLWIGGGDG